MKLSKLIAPILIALSFLFSQAFADQSSLFSPTTGTVSGLNLSNNYNNAFNAIASCNSGAIAPANTITASPIAGQCWMDTSSTRYKLKVFDGTSWLTTAVLDSINHVWMPVVGGGSGTLASAGTTDLGSTAESYITITGTATITSFGSSLPVGASKVLRFASSGAGITYNATSMLLPQGVSVVTVSGDTAIAVSLGSGNWLVIYLPPTAALSGNNPFTGINTHAGLETFNGGLIINGVTNKAAITGGQIATPGGRLTLTSLAPALITDVVGGTTVYYTPYLTNLVTMYNGTNWEMFNFSEVSQTLSDTTKSPAAAAASNAYDVFAWNDAGTFRATRGPTWTTGGGSNTVRGSGAGSTVLTRQNGVLVNQFAITNGPAVGKGLYVGSFITNASNSVDWVANPAAAAGGSNARINIWNMYNRIDVAASSLTSTASYTYALATIRSANASTTNRVTAFFGLAEDVVDSMVTSIAGTAGSGRVAVGVGIDSTTAYGGTPFLSSSPTASTDSFVANNKFQAQLGSHFYQWLEASPDATTTTFVSVSPYVSGITVSWKY